VYINFALILAQQYLPKKERPLELTVYYGFIDLKAIDIAPVFYKKT
jgi:hypothetical protein